MISLPIVERLNNLFQKNGVLDENQFEIQTLLGKGSFGQVFRVVHKESQKTYALKVLEKQQIIKLNLVKQLQNEISILASCNHPNIIKLYAVMETDTQIQLVLEMAQNGTLYHKLKKLKKFTEACCKKYLTSILKALIYLHSQNPPVLHRDLKPENILINKQDEIKIIDFGWSNRDDDLRNTFCGTPDYLSPEMIRGDGHNDKLDVWTAGVLMYELLHGKAPFTPKEHFNNRRLAQRKLEKNILDGQIYIDQNLTQQAKEVIKAMLLPDQYKRPSAQDCLRMEFFSDVQISMKDIQDEQSEIQKLKEKLDKKQKQIEELLIRNDYLEKKVKKEKERSKSKEISNDNFRVLEKIKKLENDLIQEKNTVKYMFQKTKEITDKIQIFYEKNFDQQSIQPKQQMISFQDTNTRLDKIFQQFENRNSNLQNSFIAEKEKRELNQSTLNSNNQNQETLRTSRSSNVSPIRFVNNRNQSFTKLVSNYPKLQTYQTVLRQEQTLKDLFKRSNQIQTF